MSFPKLSLALCREIVRFFTHPPWSPFMQRLFIALFCLVASARLSAVSPNHSHAPGMLGVALHEILTEEAARFNLPGEYGAWVVEVAPGSPAAVAGISVDDVILAYNGQRVESARTMQRFVAETPAGRTVELRLVRGGTPVLVMVKLGAAGTAPAAVAGQPAAEPPAPAATPRPPRRFGVGVEVLAPAVAEHFGLPVGSGLIVRQVQPESAAAKAGVQPRDILATIGGIEIRSTEDISKFINEMPGDSTELTIVRGNDRVTLTLGF